MEYSKYNKTMVLLSEENRDFASRADRPIYGNMRIETGNNKGAVSLSVQNLRFFERSKYVYKLILFGEKKERTIHAVIGTLILNRFGLGENYYRFDPKNVDGKGNRLSDYSIAIVAAVSMRDNKEPLHPVMKGRLSGGAGVMSAAHTASAKAENSRESFDENNRENNYAENSRESLDENICENNAAESRRENNTENSSKHNTESKTAEQQSPRQEQLQSPRMPNTQENRRREPNADSSTQENRRREPNADSSTQENRQQEHPVTYNKFYNQYLKIMCEKAIKATEIYDNIVPFSRDQTKGRWKKIANVKNLPMVSPGAVWSASKYRHYIFGENSKCYLIGVPGRFLNEEQPDSGRSGFTLWQPITGAEGLEATKEGCSLEKRMTAYGYWIAAISKETGDVIEPV